MGRRRIVAVVSYQKTWSSSETWLTGCWTLCCTKLHANSPPPSPVVLHSTLRYYEYVRWNADRRRPFANRRMAGTAKQRMQLSGFEDLSVRDGRTVTAAAEAVEDEYWKAIYACHLHCAIYLLVYSSLFPSQRKRRWAPSSDHLKFRVELFLLFFFMFLFSCPKGASVQYLWNTHNVIDFWWSIYASTRYWWAKEEGIGEESAENRSHKSF